MASQTDTLTKWSRNLNSKTPLLGTHLRLTACRKLAADKSPRRVPFLVSALANSDEEIRRIAEDGLKSLSDPEAIDALRVGYLLTHNESVFRILTTLGCDVPEPSKLSGPSETASDDTQQGWRFWQIQNDRDGTVLAFVPQGDFLAGEDGFRVHLPAYYIALACVTNAQYVKFLSERRPEPGKLGQWINLSHQYTAIHKAGQAYEADPEKADFPVIWVTWEGANAYCKWAGLRLSTELEWEKGARGVDGRLYPWGDEWADGRPEPTTDERKPEEITSVRAYPSARSPYGLYEMTGNVYEWCADSYEERAYERYSQGDLTPPQQGENKVLRGGPWCFGTPAHLRTEYRKGTAWRAGTHLCGFRCAKAG